MLELQSGSDFRHSDKAGACWWAWRTKRWTQLIKQYCDIRSVWIAIEGIPRAREIKMNKEDSNPRPKGMGLLELRRYTWEMRPGREKKCSKLHLSLELSLFSRQRLSGSIQWTEHGGCCVVGRGKQSMEHWRNRSAYYKWRRSGVIFKFIRRPLVTEITAERSMSNFSLTVGPWQRQLTKESIQLGPSKLVWHGRVWKQCRLEEENDPYMENSRLGIRKLMDHWSPGRKSDFLGSGDDDQREARMGQQG